MAQADEESADLTAALACGSAFEEQRGPQGATRALELLSQIKQGSRENGTTARAIFFSAFGDLISSLLRALITSSLTRSPARSDMIATS